MATNTQRNVIQQRNDGAQSLFASVHILEEWGCDVEFRMPCEQELVVKRDGIRYEVRQLGRPQQPYRYGVGVTIDGEMVRTHRYENAHKSMLEAVIEVREMLKADPRQSPITRV